MDMETVLPMQTLSDLVKELKESAGPKCNCDNCECGDKE